MRILVVDTCYEPFLASHYLRRPGLEQTPYDAQWRVLMDTFFGTADAYSHYLGAAGHDAVEVVANCDPLQRAWARERGLPTDRPDWREYVVLAQVREFEPDVVYFQNLHWGTDHLLEEMRRRSRLLAGQIASETPSAARLRRFDLLLSSFPHFVELFRAAGISAEFLRIGFDPRVLTHLDRDMSTDPEQAVVFVGSLNRTQHWRSNGILARAARRLPIDFWGPSVSHWPPWSPVRRRYRGQAWGLEMYAVLRSAAIALNRHIQVARGYANNMRLFEATGVGTLLLTDRKANLHEMFVPDREVVTYESVGELVAKARYYLDHDDERRAVAAAGQERTLRDHTYARRMAELAEILEGCLR